MGWEDEAGNPANGGGKRIRPALCLAAAQLLGGPVAEAMPGAVAVELVHNFSLVHDEVQDHDAERHHRPTLWARLGEAQSINVGDYIYTRAIQALTDGAGPIERRMAALSVLNVAIADMIRGQWQDIEFESLSSVTVDQYLGMVGGKTGALLGAPLEMGALLAGATAPVASTLGRWGYEVGLAFQIQDDYLGIWGDPGQTGKSNTNDITRRKKTLPIVFGLQSGPAAPVIRAAFATEPDDAAIAAVTTALSRAGADQQCRDQAREHAAKAEQLLESVEISSEARSQLAEVANYFIDRDF
jgi:geranylgeranyl diphosphate synthase, type I